MFYEYKCYECNKKFSVQHGMNENPEIRCSTCNSILKKVYGNVGIQFNGSGFYVNDYKKD